MQNAHCKMQSAAELYASRLAARESDVAAIREREKQISAARLVAIAAAIALAAAQLWWWSLTAAALFVVLVIVHERVVRRRETASSAARFYRRGIERLTGAWAGKGTAGDRYRNDHHLYTHDLDIFGRGSIYELICTATTKWGQDLLANWLASPAGTVSELVSRQAAVVELRDRIDDRESMSVVGGEVTASIEGGRLEEWAGGDEVPFALWERIAAIVLPAITTIILLLTAPSLLTQFVSVTRPDAGIAARHVPLWPIIVSMAAQMLLARRLAARVDPIVAGVERAEGALGQLSRLVRLIEAGTFQSERLRSLQSFSSDGGASGPIERLRRLVSLLDSRRNQFFAAFALLFLWTTNIGIAIERWRRRHGGDVLSALRAVAEFEALASFASLAFENPDYAMPEVVEGGPCFDASALGHPLIPKERRISNDVALGESVIPSRRNPEGVQRGEESSAVSARDSSLSSAPPALRQLGMTNGARLLVVSGSNMSGKSTMLRSVGLAAVLAQAGAPACARALRISPLIVGASITINDSIQEGSSRFYAEILRIRDVIELTRGGRPVLFLLDEVLHGTNSHDRRIGAEGIVRKLVSAGAIGLVSTHDLALAELAESLAPAAANVHFEDRIEDGRVIFDYRMRPGVVTHSNALELMRAVGIEV